jgi:hypothetical protein
MNATRRTRVALALASCALITAPAAQASLQNDGRTYPQPVGDDHARTDGPIPTTPAFPRGDDHARTDAAVTVAPRVFIGDHGRSGEGIPVGPFTTPPPQTAVAASSSFDWEDAGVGFGAAAGVALLAAGTILSARKLREPRVSV